MEACATLATARKAASKNGSCEIDAFGGFWIIYEMVSGDSKVLF
jgi:hypothetical protein